MKLCSFLNKSNLSKNLISNPVNKSKTLVPLFHLSKFNMNLKDNRKHRKGKYNIAI